jgi:alkanesulfonate monooxygenase SsuD/methylene tetrahydromethanopterin reductase-like flavin-dependent oxidoreductase (luciferase family)
MPNAAGIGWGAGRSQGLGALLVSGPSQPSAWAEAPRTFAAFEAAGCSAIWLADHLFWGAPMPEALVMAAAAASSTSHCTIGTGVLQLPLRRAAAVAKAAATIQALSAGRFVLGVGAGEHETEFVRTGVDFQGRGAALDEGIDAMRSLWRPAEERYAQRPVPAAIPIWVGGRSVRALQRAAARGDGWMPIFVTPEAVIRGNTALDELLRRRGRPVHDVTRAAVAIVAPTGPGRSRSDALEWMGRVWSMPEATLGRYLVSGPADACAAELGRFVASGVEHVAVLPASERPLEVFAEINEAFLAQQAAVPAREEARLAGDH